MTTSRHVEDPATSAPELVPEAPWRWRIERTGGMRVPGLVYATAPLLPPPGDQSLRQVADVATLPGVVDASFAMPDVHWGYGFPIGGVAATDVADGGVVSPGGVGFDISCGVRLLVSDVDLDRARAHLPELLDVLGATVHRGVGRGGSWRQDVLGLRAVLLEGAADAVARGWGEQRDLDRCEDLGRLPGASLTAVSERAVQRGLGQLGSLGAGNHFLEVQVVDRVLDQDAAAAYGLREGQVCVMIHCGSRGLGHQVCSDHVRAMERCMPRYGISVPDPQLACAPVDSPEGQAYLGAMAAAANFARANRHVLGVVARRAVEQTLHGRLDLLYDVSHNLAKLELHDVAVDGRARPTLLCVHRKGATRAFGPGHPDLPEELRATGQPVLVPGSMGTASWVLVGTAQGHAFASACHGAGRSMSRHAALRRTGGREVAAGLADAGVLVRGTSWRGLAEEAPFAYKDVDAVVGACEQAGLARRVARLRPVGVVKG